MDIALLSPAVGTGNIGDQFIELAIRRLLGDEHDYQRFSIRRALDTEEMGRIAASDVAVLCGTNLYQRDWHSALTPDALRNMRVPVVPLGVGSSAAHLEDRAVGEETRTMIHALHSSCVEGSVRDRHSLQVVLDSGVENVALTGCPVLFWARQPEIPAFGPEPKRRVVLTARNWLMHRWPDNVDHPVQIELLSRMLTEFAGNEVVFAIHEEYDERLVDLLGIPRSMVFMSDRASDYIDLYSDPGNVVVAMRLHAGMLAVANGVPAMFIGHDTRTYAFCELLDIPYVDLFAEDVATRCIRETRRLLAGDNASLAGAATSFPDLRRRMSDCLRGNGLPDAAVFESVVEPSARP